ncbi:MAG: rRNA maturation RNase YbeY [Clostridia bacterium]|nr:rRNA maturation RNase YbeY [Clostridia bacterium]
MSVKVTIYDKQKKFKMNAEIRKLIRKACSAALRSEEFTGNAEIDVSIVDDEAIREINRECRNIDFATDVLSFPLGDNGVYDVNPATGAYMLGDVVLSAEHADMQAKLYGHAIEREIAYLTVHSVLHLLGFDHVNSESEKTIMRTKEEKIMKILNLERN